VLRISKYNFYLNALLTTKELQKHLVNYVIDWRETFDSSQFLTFAQDKLLTFLCRGHRIGVGVGQGSRQMGKIVKRFTADESASATMEYGLIAAGLSVAIVAVLQGIGMRLSASLGGTQASTH
jgi:pilus assembly protein Flp/PilA